MLRDVAASYDGHDEALVGLDGDAEVVAVEVDDLVALETRVQLGELLQRLRGRPQHERQQLLQVDVGEVAFLDVGDGGDLAVRARQVLDDLPADAAHRLAPALGGHRAACGGANVLLGDPPTRPGRRHRCELDAELLGDAPHERRRLHLAALARSDRSRGQSLGHGRCGRVRKRDRSVVVGADHDEHRADRGDLALRDEDARDEARGRRGDLDGRLVGLDLDERLVLGDLVADRDEPARHLALGQPLAQVGQLERVRHGGGAYRRGRPTQALGGTSRMRRPSPARQSETACSSPASSAATSRGT